MKTNKKELTVFAVCAYAVPFLMMPLLYICLQNGQDTSIFANAQMFYPAAGVMLAFLLARRPDTPKRFYILHLLVMFLLNNKLDYRTQNFTISLLVVILKRFMFFSSCCYLNIFQIYSQSTCSCDMDDFSKTQNQQLLTFEAAAGKSV